MAVSGCSSCVYFLFFIVFVISTVHCADVLITHSPDYVKFRETQHSLDLNSLPDVVLSLFGLTTSHDFKWDGLETGSAFHRPKANVLITVEGVATGAADITSDFVAKYTLDTIKGSVVDVERMSKVLQFTFPESLVITGHSSIAEGVKESEIESVDSVSVNSLNLKEDVDRNFIKELQLINAISHLLKRQADVVRDNAPDVFTFNVAGYRHVVNKYGDSTPQAEEARKLLSQAIKHVTKTFRIEYEDSVVVEVLTVPGEDLVFKSRKGRDLKAAKDPSGIAERLNLAAAYDENFPAIFNIILWTMVILAVATFAISYGMWNMDNGRDSIYMLTTPRLKKE